MVPNLEIQSIESDMSLPLRRLVKLVIDLAIELR